MESSVESCQDFMWALIERMTKGLMRMRPPITRIMTTMYSMVDWALREESTLNILPKVYHKTCGEKKVD
jgi:hypothetical protein